MIIKAKNTNTIKSFFLSIIMVAVCMALFKFFFLFPNTLSDIIKGAYGDSTRTLDMLCVLFLLIYILNQQKIKIPKFIILIFISTISVFVTAVLTDPDNAVDKWSSFLVLPLVYLCIHYFIDNDSRLMFLINMLQIFSLTASVLLVYQAFLINTGGQTFLHMHFWEAGFYNPFRNGLIRATENEVLYLMVYSCSLAILKNRKEVSKLSAVISILNIILTISNFIYVDQTRMILLVAIFVFGICFFFDLDKNKKTLVLRIIILIVILTTIFVFWENIVSTLNLSSSEKSVVNRINGYGYYFVAGLSNFFGLGFSEDLNNLLRNVEDVGIIGTFGQFGYIVLIVYIIILIRMFNYVVRIQKASKSLYSTLSINIFIVIAALSLTTMSMFSYGLMQVFAISIALIEFMCNRQCKGVSNEIIESKCST